MPFPQNRSTRCLRELRGVVFVVARVERGLAIEEDEMVAAGVGNFTRKWCVMATLSGTQCPEACSGLVSPPDGFVSPQLRSLEVDIMMRRIRTFGTLGRPVQVSVVFSFSVVCPPHREFPSSVVLSFCGLGECVLLALPGTGLISFRVDFFL